LLILALLPHPFLGIFQNKADLYHCPFLVGKFTSDSIALHLGKFASENQQSIIDNFFVAVYCQFCFGICDAILFVFSSIGEP
jgi:hypothetical protein